MRISHFFIDRPIFASVVSIIFVILGGVAFWRLPVAQYPEISPPTITVSGQYPGASADVVAATVVTPIEQQINGVENMIYLSSNSTGDGRFTISVSFELGTNLDIAQVQVQNRVSIAQPRLPVDVRNIGVTVNKSSPDLMMVVHLYSPDKSRDTLFISNYTTIEITDAITRVDGVGSLIVFGSQIMLRVLNRFPILVVLGAGLLGWVAGEILVSDPALQSRLHYDEHLVAQFAKPVLAIAVMAVGTVLSWRMKAKDFAVVDLAPEDLK